MKYCPNPQCRYALRHHEGQEYRDEAVSCADCGAELTSVRPVWTAPVAKPRDVPWIRLALTLCAPLLIAWLAPKMLMPVWPERRLYAVESALAALGRSGIPSLARSVNQRALWCRGCKPKKRASCCTSTFSRVSTGTSRTRRVLRLPHVVRAREARRMTNVRQAEDHDVPVVRRQGR